MASSILEQLRSSQEEIECLNGCIVKLLNERDSKSKHRVFYEHAIRERLVLMQQHAQRCLELYKDADSAKAEEISYLAGQNQDRTGSKMTDVWTNFYDRLKNIKDYYRKFEDLNTSVETRDVKVLMEEAIQNNDVELQFSIEEQLGKFVDMNQLYYQYCNLNRLRNHRMNEHRLSEVARLKKHGTQNNTAMMEPFEEIDYISYLKTFDRFQEIPRYCKYRDKGYETYLVDLESYLQSYFLRQNPLANHDKLKQQFLDDFENRWQLCSIPEWETYTYKLPLYVLPSDKLFNAEGPYEYHKKGKKYQASLLQFQSKTMEEQSTATQDSCEHDKCLARLEFFIGRYREALSDTIHRTIENLQKKQSRSDRELNEEESDGEEIDPEKLIIGEARNEDSEDEDEKPIYNPLNLPLGWDGKPIPFWLYKLHGLGTEYKCEICGNYSYWGRRAFERHFQEWRHAFGMRSLKIPNTIHFKEITKIDEAITLYEKLKKLADFNAFTNEHEIECEDSQGNVMSARAFEDLRRQGLL